MKKHKLLIILKIIVGVPLLIAALGYITMSLWNWLIPTLFNGPAITIWQTFGIVLLSKILFGGFKGKGGCCCKKNDRQSWKEHMKAKWDNLSTEERSSLKNKFFSKCYSKDDSSDMNSNC
jgi:hypothetical protein